ncbi:unnamed protein product [Clonostachys rosea]|uniref:F-box domain-containing protein n=1 Tax=Bionectria ochroleuca TaxID=29856 RepID=A0ABY6UGX1_BIOOC|nr:unnamed protein product [Clonostachys rosea]
MPNISCILCGCRIDDGDDFPEWMSKFRVLYAIRESWRDVHLSGVGERRQSDGVIPLDASLNFDIPESAVDGNWVEVDLTENEFGKRYRPQHRPPPFWGFALHCACLDLLWDLNPRMRSADAIQALFHICRSQPSLHGTMKWGHDYGGLFYWYPDVSDCLPGEELELKPFSASERNQPTHDPSDVTIFDIEVDHGDSKAVNEAQEQQMSVVGTATTTDPFRLLPCELILCILNELPSSDVCSLRLASRMCASTTLSDTFWRSRFLPGYECPHLYSLVQRLSSPGKWRSTYMNAKRHKNSVAMDNRKRTWTLAYDISEMVEKSLSFTNIRVVDKSPTDAKRPTQASPGQTWKHVESAVCPLKSRFDDGSRALYEDSLAVESPIVKVSASLLSINEKIYVCGLELTQESGMVMTFGYYSSNNSGFIVQKPISLETFDSFAGFHVAVDARGIRGLRAVSISGNLSPWVGDYNDVPKKKIIFPEAESVHCIRGGFDALKLVSLSILGSVVNEQDDQDAEARLWYPELLPPNTYPLTNYAPRKRGSLRGEPRRRLKKWLPYCHCLFGGADGKLLPHLTSITVWTTDAFDYDDGTDDDDGYN